MACGKGAITQTGSTRIWGRPATNGLSSRSGTVLGPTDRPASHAPTVSRCFHRLPAASVSRKLSLRDGGRSTASGSPSDSAATAGVDGHEARVDLRGVRAVDAISRWLHGRRSASPRPRAGRANRTVGAAQAVAIRAVRVPPPARGLRACPRPWDGSTRAGSILPISLLGRV